MFYKAQRCIPLETFENLQPPPSCMKVCASLLLLQAWVMCCDGCKLKKTLRTVEEAVYGVIYGAQDPLPNCRACVKGRQQQLGVLFLLFT